MRRKKLLSLTIPLMAGTALLLFPSAVKSADVSTASGSDHATHLINNDDVVIDSAHCEGGEKCGGHIISGTTTGTADIEANVIIVKEGVHNITLDGVEIDASANDNVCAFEIQNDAVVNLTLNKGSQNTLKSGDGRAGICVMSPKGTGKTATLNIKGEGSLTAEAKIGGAGIGAEDYGDAGNITIESGTVTAKGGERCAGIGGAYTGSAGKIKISGGDITAIGGDADKDTEVGSGIGCGGGFIPGGSNHGLPKGEVTISGGKVSAEGGKYPTGSTTSKSGYGINCSTLSSDKESATLKTTRIYEGSIENNDRTAMDGFNAMVWDLAEKNCEVYGDAIMEYLPQSWDKITINDGCSLAILEKGKFSLNKGSVIEGESKNGTGKIINGDYLRDKGGTYEDVPIQQVSLTKEDILVDTSKLVYSGSKSNLLNLFTKSETGANRDPSAPDQIIDRPDLWEPSVTQGDNPATLRDAGDYLVSFKRPGYRSIDIPVTIKKKEITRDMINYDSIKEQTYTGQKIIPNPQITYNGDELSINDDYLVTPGDYNIDVKDAGQENPPSITIRAANQRNGNYSTDVKGILLNFSIVASPIKDAKVTLKGEGITLNPETGEYTGEYNGSAFSPEVTVTLPAKNEGDGSTGDDPDPLVKGTDYEIEISPKNDPASELLTDADTYVYTITGIGNYSGTPDQTVNFSITPKPVPLNMDGLSAEDKPHDGSSDVKLTGLSIQTLGKDEVNIEAIGSVLDAEGNETTNVGEYKSVKIKSIELKGPKGKNYTVEPDVAGNVVALPENQPVNIYEADAPNITGIPYEANGDKFICSVKLDSPSPDAKYMYSMDGGEPQESESFEIDPKTEHYFEVYAVGADGQKASGTGKSDLIYFDLLDREKPTNTEMGFEEDGTPQLKFESDEESLKITAELPYLEGAQYSFTGTTDEDFLPKKDDSLTIADVRFKKDCESDTSYTGYIRYAETKTHKASSFVEITGTAPKINALPPVMTLLNEDGTELDDDTLEANEFVLF